MRRRRFRKPALQMALFPFLAVLLCTMGSLIVVLVTLTQQAKVYASHVSEDRKREQQAALAAKSEERRAQIDDAVWRRDVLEQQRGQLTQNLADRRLQLSHLEDHIRRLQQQWKQLQEQAAQLESLGATHSQDESAVRAELEKIRAAVEAAQRELEAAKTRVAERPRSYAIIPYDGPNGTRRRPIYIECTEEGIVLQPEGVVLTANDFAGPLGPGNPLDASLRTIREYLARSGGIQSEGEPYPLLVVRPSGAVAYSVARSAMKSWDEEFGYELVEDSVVLKYPPANPELRDLLVKSVRDARQRQSALAAAMPNQFRGDAFSGFAATPTHGGFVRVGPRRGGPAESGSRGPGTAPGFRHSPEVTGGSSPEARRFAPPRTAPSPPKRAVPSGESTSQLPPQTPADRSSQAPNDLSSQTPAHRSSQAAADRSSKAPADRSIANAQAGSPMASDRGAADGPQAGEATAVGNTSPLASTRGNNWALPKATVTATGITRPIYVRCLPDQLLILPERGDSSSTKVVPARGPLVDSIDQFVSAIWQHMDQWGMAVANGYWKPVLHVNVARGAEDRFEELQSLMEGSGVEVRREQR